MATVNEHTIPTIPAEAMTAMSDEALTQRMRELEREAAAKWRIAHREMDLDARDEAESIEAEVADIDAELRDRDRDRPGTHIPTVYLRDANRGSASAAAAIGLMLTRVPFRALWASPMTTTEG